MPKTEEPKQKGLERRTSPPFRRSGCRPVDAEIRREVRILWEGGVETFESCQGGKGHSFPEPTVRFHGGSGEGFRALGIALQAGLKVSALRRYYDVLDGEAHGPYWEMVF